MCDLSGDDRKALQDVMGPLEKSYATVAGLFTSAQDTAYMDHESLATELDRLAAAVREMGEWVAERSSHS